MFLSQAIAQNPKFLLPSSTSDTRSIVDIRVKIMNAAKFVVGSDQLDLDNVNANSNSRAIEIIMNTDVLEERLAIYKQYSRLPFQSIFIENNKYGLLIEVMKNDVVIITPIIAGGAIIKHGVSSSHKQQLVGHAVVSMIAIESTLVENSFVPIIQDGTLRLHFYHEKYQSVYKDEEQKFLHNQGCLYTLLQVAEILLFLNVRNKKLNLYKLNKHESVKIPKPLVAKYEYHVLDVYHNHTVYQSAQDIEDVLFCDAAEAVRRRMHFVRGHFKAKKNGLFWWNPFMRNTKNADVGMVDKTYRLKEGPKHHNEAQCCLA